MIYIIKVKKLYVILGTIAVILSAIFFYHNPTIPFIVAVVATTLALTFSKDEPNQWLGETWGFTKQIMPLLAAGVLVAGFLLGSQNNNNGIIPNEWIANLVGGNSLFSNFFASITGAFMYFATLTEIPILQGLINSGMGKGPALALLLAGPALSLPNMLVIKWRDWNTKNSGLCFLSNRYGNNKRIDLWCVVLMLTVILNPDLSG